MQPDRSCTINGRVVREYYWAGDYPVYVDNRQTKHTYEDAVDLLKAGIALQMVEADSDR